RRDRADRAGGVRRPARCGEQRRDPAGQGVSQDELRGMGGRAAGAPVRRLPHDEGGVAALRRAGPWPGGDGDLDQRSLRQLRPVQLRRRQIRPGRAGQHARHRGQEVQHPGQRGGADGRYPDDRGRRPGGVAAEASSRAGGTHRGLPPDRRVHRHRHGRGRRRRPGAPCAAVPVQGRHLRRHTHHRPGRAALERDHRYGRLRSWRQPGRLKGEHMTSTDINFDAIVVGAGAGGLCAAARLTHLGYRTLVVERLAHVGGRASTRDTVGFKVNNGAIVIEVEGITQQTFEEVGAKFDVRQPNPPILYRIGGKDVDVTGGGWGFLLSKLTRQGAKLLSGLGAARKDDGLPENELSTADWVAKYTKNESVHGIFRNMCGSVFAVGSEELPARVFLTYFTRKSAFKKFGFCPEGTIGIWRSLAENIEANGGQVWLSAEVRSLTVADGRVTGAVIERDGRTIEVSTRIAVSDAGPAATVKLVGEQNFPEDYRESVRRGDRPC